MDTPTPKSKSSSKDTTKTKTADAVEDAHVCKYCNRSFKKISTLQTHICVKKRRATEPETAGFRLGLYSFNRFYELAGVSRGAKTKDDYINSPYYIDFAKFGNYLDSLRPLYVEKYIEFVILNGVKLKDWCNDNTYSVYIDDIIKKEPADSATERTIEFIVNWSTAHNTNFTEFFNDISANEAAQHISMGRISPWVIYLSKGGQHLVSQFTADHKKIIGQLLDPGFWMRKFRRENDDLEYIRKLLEDVGL